MTSALIFIGLPLIVFAIVDSMASLKVALISAVFMAMLELGFTYFYFGELDAVSYITVVMIVVLALVSYKTNSPLYFKLKPALGSLLIGGIFIGTYYFSEPIFRSFFNKYQPVIVSSIELNEMAQQNLAFFATEAGQDFLGLITLSVGLMLVLHGIATAYAAYKWPKLIWLLISTAGLFASMILGFVLAPFMGMIL